jgi:hypothetical protein
MMQFARVSPGPNRGMSMAQESGNRLADPLGVPRRHAQKTLRCLGALCARLERETPLREGLKINYADFLAGGGRTRD